MEVTWETAKGERKTTKAKCGMNLMRVAHANHIDLEGEKRVDCEARDRLVSIKANRAPSSGVSLPWHENITVLFT